MHRTRWYVATLTAVAVIIVTFAMAGARAQQPPAGQGSQFGPPQGPPPFPFAQLQLTDQQKQQIQAIMEADRQNAPGAAMMDLQRQLQQAIFADVPDESVIGSIEAKILDAEKANLDRRIAHQKQIAGILTPEQRQKMANLPFGPGRGRGRGGMMGRGMGAGRGPMHSW